MRAVRVLDVLVKVALVLLPTAAAATTGSGASVGQIVLTLALTLAKVSAFVALMLLGGRRVIPWMMHYTAHTGSRELFRLAVYAVALGVAYGASALFFLFGIWLGVNMLPLTVVTGALGTTLLGLGLSGIVALLAAAVAAHWWRQDEKVFAVALVGLGTCLASPVT